MTSNLIPAGRRMRALVGIPSLYVSGFVTADRDHVGTAGVKQGSPPRGTTSW